MAGKTQVQFLGVSTKELKQNWFAQLPRKLQKLNHII